MEIRERIEFDHTVLGAPQPIKKQYIVHKVDPEKDSLMVIAFRYNTTQAAIKRVNDMPFGD